MVNMKDLNNNKGNFNGTKIQLLDLNKNIIDEKIVDNSNSVVFKKVIYGDYYLKVLDMVEGYVSNNEFKLIKVDESLEEFNLYSKVIENKIIFNKYLFNTLTGESLVDLNSTFKIYDSNNQEIAMFDTNNNGYLNIVLSYGKYLIKQVSGSDNYLYVDDFYIDVSEDDLVQEFDLYSKLIVGNINIINTDYDSNLPILDSDAYFSIRNFYTLDVIVDSINTNDFGIIDIKLPVGKYILEQIVAFHQLKYTL